MVYFLVKTNNIKFYHFKNRNTRFSFVENLMFLKSIKKIEREMTAWEGSTSKWNPVQTMAYIVHNSFSDNSKSALGEERREKVSNEISKSIWKFAEKSHRWESVLTDLIARFEIGWAVRWQVLWWSVWWEKGQLPLLELVSVGGNTGLWKICIIENGLWRRHRRCKMLVWIELFGLGSGEGKCQNRKGKYLINR